MQVYGIILGLVGVLLLLWGWGLILIAAFRKQVAWGFCVLFLPPACLIFAVCHWGKASPGVMRFLVAIPLLVLGTAGMDFGDSSSGSSQVLGEEQQSVVVEYLKDDLELPSAEDLVPGSGTDQMAAPEPVWEKPEPVPALDPSTIISLNRAGEFVDRRVMFTRANGEDFEAVMVGADNFAVTVSQRVGDGFMEYPIPKTELRHFRLAP